MSYIASNSEKYSFKKYGAQEGVLVTDQILNSWLTATTASSVEIKFPEGRWILPVDFEYDFGANSVTLSGVAGKTIITTYDGTPGTNFAIPEKIDITRPKPLIPGVYQIDIIGYPYNGVPLPGNVNSSVNHIHYDFRNVTPTLDNYIQVTSGGVVQDINLAGVKALGYMTELDVQSSDPGIDGLYVVAKHKYWSYGGGQAHLNLKFDNGEDGATGKFNTGGQNVWYLQGTVLKRQGGVWSRHYTGAGFASKGNMIVQDLIFENVQFYLFSPFDISGAADTLSNSDNFILSNCHFRHCGRVLASMSYAGIDQSINWWTTLQVYNRYGILRFKDFTITNCQFHYIHTSIVWGFPPSENFTLKDNNIHDCYTIVCCFNLFIAFYGDFYFWANQVTQTITGNSFINVRPLGEANWTTTLIRTSGMATVNNNQFIDVTPQVCYLSGGNSTFSNNVVEVFYNQPPSLEASTVILSKSGTITNVIANNTISAPVSSFVQIEGTSCQIITGNNFIGGTKTRYITTNTNIITKDRTYNVRNVSVFHTLANTDPYTLAYDSDIDQGHWIFYNKRRRKWERAISLPINYVFSKNDEVENKEQFIKIVGNILECDTITNLGSAVYGQQAKSITLMNNDISYCTVLHLCNGINLQEYICSDNNFKSCSISMTTGSGFTNQVKSLFFENNKIGRAYGSGILLWAYYELIFRGNTIYEDSALSSPAIYADFNSTNSIVDFGVNLLGYTTSRIIVMANKFISSHTRYGGIQITNPYDVEIVNNSFNLTTPSYQLFTTAYRRSAVYIVKTTLINSVSFIGNTIYPEVGRTNNIIEFDGSTSTIDSLTINNNITPLNTASINSITKTLLATTKTFTYYFKGGNMYQASLDEYAGLTNAAITPK